MGAYFDNAATTYPKPNAVYDYMDKFYRENGGNAGRGQYKLAATASRVISETRKMIQKVLQCENKEVIFAPSATLAMNMVLQGIVEPGMHIYISPFEHNAVTRTLHALEATKNVTVHILPYSVETGYDLAATRREFNVNKPNALVISQEEAIRETENLNDGEVFLVKDLFKGYVWNRIPRKDRLLLGTLFLNHVSKMNGNLKAIEKTSSNQQRYKKTIDKF